MITFLISFKTASLLTMSSDLKMSAKKRNYLDFPVGFLEGSGLSSTSRLYRKFISICFFLPITFFLVYLVVRKFWDEKRDILLIAEVFESLTTCAHVLLKLTKQLNLNLSFPVVVQKVRDVRPREFNQRSNKRSGGMFLGLQYVWCGVWRHSSEENDNMYQNHQNCGFWRCGNCHSLLSHHDF